MRTSGPGPPSRDTSLRIMLVDDHEISRAACRALLRAEGADVIADLQASDDALGAVRALRPEVVLVDVTPPADTGLGIARALRGLPAPPIVILTSSTDRTQFGPRLNSHRFIPKADICVAAIARLIRAPETEGRPASG